MKKYFLVAITVLFSISFVKSQTQLIAVQHPVLDTAMFFTNIQNAIDSAWVGSSIYLPAVKGADYPIPGFTVNKKLHIFGTGHYTDSTQATGRAKITGDVNIVTGADSGSISGIYFQANVSFGSVNSFYFLRNSVFSLIFSNITTKIHLNSNLINGLINGSGATSLIFEKNIINGQISNLSDAFFSNNIFLKECNYQVWNCCNIINKTFENINNSIFENNIFMNKNDYTVNCSCWYYDSYYNRCACFHSYVFLNNSNNNLFNNNLFESEVPIPYETNIGNNNIGNLTHEEIFINQSGHTFNYTHDYRLHPDCLGVGAGTDSTDIGIYGSEFPYKEGAVPPNPHFKRVVIKPDIGDGILQVNIEVEAQKR